MNPQKVICACLLLLTSSALFAEDTHRRQLVLVAAGHSTAVAMNNGDVRRIYLGLRDANGAQQLLPLGNRSDLLLYEVFLQKVIFMSARNYERQMLSHLYQSGSPRVQMYENRTDILQKLKRDPQAVSYMWDSDLKADPELRVLQVIWEGSVE